MKNILTFLPRGTTARFEFMDESGHWEPRTAIIWGVRNLEQKPLSTKAIVERPDVDRSQYLLYAWDLARGDWRRFYLHRVRNVELTDLNAILGLAMSMQRSAEMNRRTA